MAEQPSYRRTPSPVRPSAVSGILALGSWLQSSLLKFC
jgi:hypothetical protein